MKILSLTPAQASFIEVEIIGRYEDDGDPQVAHVIEVVKHFGRRFGGGLAVPNKILSDLILETINGIDDAIEMGETQKQGYGTKRQARALHRTGAALLKKVWGALA